VNRWGKAFLVCLRIAVGWHFLYEGLWKIDSDTGVAAYSTPWYVLQPSVARLREYYASAPPGDYARADNWFDEIVKAFKARNHALDEGQKARLGELRDKVKLALLAASRGEIAPSEIVGFDWIYLRDEVLGLSPPPAGEVFTALPFIQASAGPFRGAFRAAVPDIDGLARLGVAPAQSALDARRDEILRHFARSGRPFDQEQTAKLKKACEDLKAAAAATLNDDSFRARLADYRALRARVDRDPASVTAPFSRERLAEDRRKLDEIAGELLAFVNDPVEELAVQAQQIATVAQLAAGPFPATASPSVWIDRFIKFGLTAMGACLLLGLFTPVMALAAAAQLLVFYLASPPWPGLPAATLGGHYLYVDRNLIEMFAALAIAATGTGRIAGLDAYLTSMRRQKPAPGVSTTTSTTQPVAAR
jgi:uncharacterized membrane protein YphA (DoxX/SURF4 family)